MFGQQFHGLAVGIGDDKFAVNHHHRGLRLVHRRLQTRHVIFLLPLSGDIFPFQGIANVVTVIIDDRRHV